MPAPSPFARPFWTALALVFLGLTWLWEALAPLVAALVARIPLERVKAAIARFLDRLPPYPTLLVFLIPLVASELVKAFAIVLFAKKLIVLGALTYLFGEVVRFALVAYLFQLCRDKLLSIPWVLWCYERLIAAHHWAKAQVEPLRAFIAEALREAGLSGRPGRFLDKVAAVWRLARRRSNASPA